VRLKQGDYLQATTFSDDPVAVAREWVKQGADRLHLVDLDGAKAGRPINETVIRRIVDSVPVPCQLGGGIRSDADLESVLRWGVRWPVLGTQALRDPVWLRTQSERHPGRLVLGLDARNGLVATDGWLKTSSTRAIDLVRAVEAAPLFAIVYTDIAKDGMMSGPNFESLLELKSATPLPVIASGGVSALDHVTRLRAEGVFGCIIGRALYEGQVRLPDALSPRGSPCPATPSTM
jgi:phosphoribosylformimino-5-aminoimidazole carboxamide ribotide isomerase